MGGVSMGTIVQTVVGVGGVVGGLVSGQKQAKYMNQLVNQGAENRARVAGVDEYFLGGGRAQELNIPGMQNIFAEVDSSVQEQLRNIDSQAAKSRQMIADSLPTGGAKLRALADLSMQTQDARGKVIRESQTKKQELDTQLTNQYLQSAMGRYGSVGAESAMTSALGNYQNTQQDLRALGMTLGSLGRTDTDEQTGVQTGLSYDEYSVPGALGGAKTEPTTGSGLLDESTNWWGEYKKKKSPHSEVYLP